MPVFGNRGAERAEDQYLLGRVRDVVATADDMRDRVEPVLDRRREVVRRPAVRAEDDDVLERLVLVLDAVEDQVVPGRDALVGHAEADRTVVLVRLALLDEPPRLRLAALEPVELERDRTVQVEAEPAQRLLDLLRGKSDLTTRVRVLDPQVELATLVAREQPVEERRVHVADVQEAGRARGHADADAHALLRRRQSRRLRSLVNSVEPTFTKQEKKKKKNKFIKKLNYKKYIYNYKKKKLKNIWLLSL